MAIVLVDHTGAGSGDGNSVTTSSINTTGANFLAAFIAYDGGTSPTPTDSKSNTWSALTTRTGNFGRGRWFYSVNPTVGSGHTASVSTTSSFPAICFLAFSGADTSSPFDDENGATGNVVTSLATGSITPGSNGEVVLVGLEWEESITGLSIDGTGFAIADQINVSAGQNYGVAAAYKIQTTAAAENRTWSWTNLADAAAAIASFKAAAGGGTDQPIEKRHGGVPFMSGMQLRGGVRGGVW